MLGIVSINHSPPYQGITLLPTKWKSPDWRCPAHTGCRLPLLQSPHGDGSHQGWASSLLGSKFVNRLDELWRPGRAVYQEQLTLTLFSVTSYIFRRNYRLSNSLSLYFRNVYPTPGLAYLMQYSSWQYRIDYFTSVRKIGGNIVFVEFMYNYKNKML